MRNQLAVLTQHHIRPDCRVGPNDARLWNHARSTQRSLSGECSLRNYRLHATLPLQPELGAALGSEFCGWRGTSCAHNNRLAGQLAVDKGFAFHPHGARLASSAPRPRSAAGRQGLRDVRNLARSMPVKTISLLSRSGISVSSNAPPAWAIASTTSTPGMIGKLGKVAGEERLVDGHILDRDDALLALNLHHAVDQKERKTMRQDRHDIGDLKHLLAVQNRVRSVHGCLPIIANQRSRVQRPSASAGSADNVSGANPCVWNFGQAAAAIIAALSVERASEGNAIGSPRSAASAVKRTRNSRLAATPPETSRLAAPRFSAARKVLRRRSSITAR